MADLICVGRATLDLFAGEVGAPWEAIHSFRAYVGGTPLNIAVGAQRLGVSTALLTGISTDGAGRRIRAFLEREGVGTQWLFEKPGTNMNAFLLSMQPPDAFEPVIYQTMTADLHLSAADARAANIPQARALLLTSVGMSAEPARTATLTAAEIASAHGVSVYVDVDYKPEQWPDADSFGVTMRTLLRLADVAIGTEAEIGAAGNRPDADSAARRLLPLLREAVIVKRGGRGATLFTKDGSTHNAPVFPAEVVNTFGAGDAFAAGVIAHRLRGGDWAGALRLGAACGAYIVGQPGCADDMPTLAQAQAVIDAGKDGPEKPV